MWLIWLYWQTGLTKQRKDAFTMSWQLNKWQYVGIQQFSDNSIHDKSIYENDIFELDGIWGWEGVGQAEVPGACRKWRCPFCSSTVLIVRLSMHHRCSPCTIDVVHLVVNILDVVLVSCAEDCFECFSNKV